MWHRFISRYIIQHELPSIGINGRGANTTVRQLDRCINQTDKACILRRRFNTHDYIALPASAVTSSLALGRRVFEIEYDDSRARSRHVDFYNCAEQYGVASEQARSSRHNEMCVSLCKKEKEKYEGETRPPFGLCASHCGTRPRIPLCFLSSRSLPFKYSIPT